MTSCRYKNLAFSFSVQQLDPFPRFSTDKSACVNHHPNIQLSAMQSPLDMMSANEQLHLTAPHYHPDDISRVMDANLNFHYHAPPRPNHSSLLPAEPNKTSSLPIGFDGYTNNRQQSPMVLYPKTSKQQMPTHSKEGLFIFIQNLESDSSWSMPNIGLLNSHLNGITSEGSYTDNLVPNSYALFGDPSHKTSSLNNLKIKPEPLYKAEAKIPNSTNSTSSPSSVNSLNYHQSSPPNSTNKRKRKKASEIERHYSCSYPSCSKAYGTLNHLNTHVSIQKHGRKRLPEEFKRLRSNLRKLRREKIVKSGQMNKTFRFANPLSKVSHANSSAPPSGALNTSPTFILTPKSSNDNNLPTYNNNNHHTIEHAFSSFPVGPVPAAPLDARIFNPVLSDTQSDLNFNTTHYPMLNSNKNTIQSYNGYPYFPNRTSPNRNNVNAKHTVNTSDLSLIGNVNLEQVNSHDSMTNPNKRVSTFSRSNFNNSYVHNNYRQRFNTS